MVGKGSGSDFLALDAGDLPPRGATQWLTTRLRDAVVDGTLPPGTALPATRTLAEDLGVSRGVVVDVYRRLADDGLVRSRTGSGTEVAALPGPATTAGAAGARASGGAAGTRPPVAGHPAVSMRHSLVERVELDLWPGVPDLSAFPRAAWLRAERAVLADPGALAYGDPQGRPELRDALSRWLARHRGVRTDPDGIVVTSGVAQALALVASVLRGRGLDRIGVEDPGSRGVRDHLEHAGMTTVPVPVDGDGLDVGVLGTTTLEAVVVTPAHQYPTGVVLAGHRRRELAAWAARGHLVVEDDYDAEHRYDRAPVTALHSLAPENVAYAGSTSKTLAPGLRLGWLVPPPTLLEEVVDAKYGSDVASPALGQLVLARLLADGDMERHLRGVRVRQRRRRDALVDALATHLPEAHVRGVAAGLHVLVTLEDVDDERVAHEASARGVRVQPLSWHRCSPGPGGLVLGYAALPPGRLAEAARRLADAVASARRS